MCRVRGQWQADARLAEEGLGLRFVEIMPRALTFGASAGSLSSSASRRRDRGAHCADLEGKATDPFGLGTAALCRNGLQAQL